MLRIKDIRAEFRALNKVVPEGEMLEVVGSSFKADEDHIFGLPNKEYIDAELEWYKSKSLNVNDLFETYGKEVPIWKSVSSPSGMINSNYGWCIFSEENGSQYANAVKHLTEDPDSRRATMIYTRPTMHAVYQQQGMNDFLCTMGVHYFIRKKRLHAVVQMRSNDAYRGFRNDIAWQRYVLSKLSCELYVSPGFIQWQAASLHFYPADRKFIR